MVSADPVGWDERFAEWLVFLIHAHSRPIKLKLKLKRESAPMKSWPQQLNTKGWILVLAGPLVAIIAVPILFSDPALSGLGLPALIGVGLKVAQVFGIVYLADARDLNKTLFGWLAVFFGLWVLLGLIGTKVKPA